LSTVRHINFRNAAYDVSNILRRKYIYGPCTDEPISMIEAAGSYAGTYYYHFDGLGSVVGLTNSSGNTVEVYEYDVYGRLGASDASHPNRFMFTGREYDKETGLYYYRARYYNPQIGRFLQTDPIGYGDGMNWYRYCWNNPIGMSDASGRTSEVSLVNDISDAEYIEYDGQWDIVTGDLQPGGRRYTERVEKGANVAKWSIRVGAVVNIVVPIVGEAEDAALGAADLGADILETAAQMVLQAMKLYDVEGYYRAYIKLKGYNPIDHPILGDWLGSIIWGDYECVWTKWVEVTGGAGWNGVSYDSWSHAFEAIHEAQAAYCISRPGHKLDVVGRDGVVSTED
jgi:RHS repeat-associated protein